MKQRLLSKLGQLAYLQTPYALIAANDAIANDVPTNNGADSSR